MRRLIWKDRRFDEIIHWSQDLMIVGEKSLVFDLSFVVLEEERKRRCKNLVRKRIRKVG